MLNYKQDTRPARGGYAPGDYINHCGFLGDKRAVTCADCAYEGRTWEEMSYNEQAKILFDLQEYYAKHPVA